MSIVYVGADHRGYNLKEKLVTQLREWGYEVNDLGATTYNPEDDFSSVSFAVGESVAKSNGMGILICGSGVGVTIAANKVIGVRASVCTTEKQVQLARSDDSINVLGLSADLVGEEENLRIAKTFLETIFSSDERFVRRLLSIKSYELETSH
jgi:ribose 5-phosphate isomerase B